MDNLLVLYTIERSPGVCDMEDINAFEAPILPHSGKEVFLGDLLKFLVATKSPLARGFAFSAEFQGQFVELPSVLSVLPVKDDDSVLLHLKKIPNAKLFTMGEQDLSFAARDRELYARGNPAVLSSSQRFSSVPLSRSAKAEREAQAAAGSARTQRVEPTRSSRVAFNESTGRETERERERDREESAGLHAIVGEDTAAAINNATEVAKEAAKSLFSWGKSVVDATSSSLLNGGLLNTLGAAGIGGGNNGQLMPGSTISVGRARVVVQQVLAEGGFGTVYLVNSEQNPSNRYALKVLLVQSRDQEKEAEVEVQSLQRFKHPNIVSLLAHATAPLPQSSSSAVLKQHLLLFPLYTQGTAWDAIERAQRSPSAPWPFSEKAVLYIIQQVASALAHMHAMGFAHRDVKPHNILIGEGDSTADRNSMAYYFGTPVLTDFGSVTAKERVIATRQDALCVEDEASRQTSAAYRAPELTSPPSAPARICEKVDIWGLGCTLYCLAFGRSPFETSRDGVQKLAILNGKYTVPPGARQRDMSLSQETLSLMDRMLRVDARERPSAEEVRRTCERLLFDKN